MEQYHFAILQILLTILIGYYITKNVEKLKTELTKKFWVKQQVWDTRRNAYDALIESFYETKTYIIFLIEYRSDYLEAFERIGYMSEGDEGEDYHNSYLELVAEEQAQFYLKYDSSNDNSDQQPIESETKAKLSELKTVLDTKSIYLHSNIGEIRTGLESILSTVFESKRDKKHDENLEEFLEEQISDYKKILVQLTALIDKTQKIASEHLELVTS